MSEPIRISRDELDAPKVDEALAEEAAIRGSWGDDGGGEVGESVGAVKRRGRPTAKQQGQVYMTAVAATAGLGALGAFLGWMLCEPLFSRDDEAAGILSIVSLAVILAGASSFVAVCDPLLSRAWARAGKYAGMGLLIGLVGGLVASFVASFLYGLGLVSFFLMLQAVSPAAFRSIQNSSSGDNLPAFFVLANMSIRGFAWAIFGVVAGVTPGIVQRSRDLIMVGILGGLVGGLMGGALFDPIGVTLGSDVVSRAVGFTCVGLMSGLAIGVVEQLSKDAWLFMEDGPLAGKQFVIYRDPTSIGSSPKCDVFLFKDSEVEPQHAELVRVGAAHEIHAVGGVPVLVNGNRTSRTRLADGDLIGIGRARFRYYVREQTRRVR